MKHTPAPWKYEKTGYIRANDLYIAEALSGPDCPDVDEVKANARLIAAAPELLEALELILEETLIDADDKVLALIALSEIRFAARAAIAKAKGES